MQPRSHRQTLEADEWVNDAVIGFCYEILSRQFLHMAFWPPAVVELLCTLGSNDSGTSARGSISSSREAMSELLPAATQATFLPGAPGEGARQRNEAPHGRTDRPTDKTRVVIADCLSYVLPATS